MAKQGVADALPNHRGIDVNGYDDSGGCLAKSDDPVTGLRDEYRAALDRRRIAIGTAVLQPSVNNLG